MVVFRPDQERDGSFVEAATLAIPFLDGVEGGFAGEVKHEKDGDGVVADEREHVDEFALAAEIPDGKGDFCIPDADGLFHEVDAWCLVSISVMYVDINVNVPNV